MKFDRRPALEMTSVNKFKLAPKKLQTLLDVGQTPRVIVKRASWKKRKSSLFTEKEP